MNPWRRGPISRNPYYHTAFHVTGISPTVVGRAALLQQLEQARNLVRALPRARAVGGVPVTEAQINTEAEVLNDPDSRLSEELMAHAPEAFLVPAAARLQEAFAPETAPDPQGGCLPVRHLRIVGPWIRCLLDCRLAETAPRPVCWPSDALPIPPFGRPRQTP